MLDRVRKLIDPAVMRVAHRVETVGLPPSFWTLLGFLISILSGLTYARVVVGGPPMAGLLILLAGGVDVLDGAVARAGNKTSRSGAFLDSTVDRLSEIAVYLGILVGGYSEAPLVLLALSLSLMVSYARARAEPLGVDLRGIGIGERPERLILLAVLSLPSLVSLAMILVALVSGITFVERFVTTLRRTSTP